MTSRATRSSLGLKKPVARSSSSSGARSSGRKSVRMFKGPPADRQNHTSLAPHLSDYRRRALLRIRPTTSPAERPLWEAAAMKPASADRHGFALTSRMTGRPASSRRRSTRPYPDSPQALQAASASVRTSAEQRGELLAGKAPHRVALLERARGPLCLVPHERRNAGGEVHERDLRHRQRLDPRLALEQGDVELASRAGSARAGSAGRGSAQPAPEPAQERAPAWRHTGCPSRPTEASSHAGLRIHGGGTFSSRAGSSGIEPAPRRDRQAGGRKQPAGRQLVGGQPQRRGRGARERHPEQFQRRGGGGVQHRSPRRRLEQVADHRTRELRGTLPDAALLHRNRGVRNAQRVKAGLDQADLLEDVGRGGIGGRVHAARDRAAVGHAPIIGPSHASSPCPPVPFSRPYSPPSPRSRRSGSVRAGKPGHDRQVGAHVVEARQRVDLEEVRVARRRRSAGRPARRRGSRGRRRPRARARRLLARAARRPSRRYVTRSRYSSLLSAV